MTRVQIFSTVLSAGGFWAAMASYKKDKKWLSFFICVATVFVAGVAYLLTRTEESRGEPPPQPSVIIKASNATYQAIGHDNNGMVNSESSTHNDVNSNSNSTILGGGHIQAGRDVIIINNAPGTSTPASVAPNSIALPGATPQPTATTPTSEVSPQLKYLMPVDIREDALKHRLAVLVVGEDSPNKTLTKAVKDMAARARFIVIDDLFTPEFITEGQFNKAFNGHPQLLQEINLTNYCDYLALCRLTSTNELRSEYQNANVANVTLELRLLHRDKWAPLDSQEYAAMGSAFDAGKAVSLAKNNLIGMLATNNLSPQEAK